MKQLLGKPVQELSTKELSDLCFFLNEEYRSGTPLVSDEQFDLIYLKALSVTAPNHVLLKNPQPEPLTAKNRVKHPEAMLSTQKAYTKEEVQKFINKCIKACRDINFNPDLLTFNVMGKLDGIAGRLSADNKNLFTRGDGQFGSDISHLLNAGLQVIGDNIEGAVGEVVVPIYYYKSKLEEEFSHPRNFISGVASADNYNPYSQMALDDGAIHLVLYKDMPKFEVNLSDLLERLDGIVKNIQENSPYALDGTIIEIGCDKKFQPLKQYMGANSHHHNWMLALKSIGEEAITTIKNITWQVGRSGRVSPVMNIEKVHISGAVISKVTGNHAAYVLNHKLGAGGEIRITRSGEIIPLHLETIKPGVVEIPQECPSCLGSLKWKANTFGVDTFLMCESDNCSSQSVNKIVHFFKTIQCDLFGTKSVEKLAAKKYTLIEQIFMMNEEAFEAVGFGSTQSKNFVAELNRVVREPLRDNLLLAALGISKLGRSDSEKLLKHYKINELKSVTPAKLQMLKGFGESKSETICKGLAEQYKTLNFLLNRNFNLKHTQSEISGEGLSGLSIVFTGSMTGSRADMKIDAKAKGAKVQSTVNSKTSYLCCGSNVGKTKIDTANELGVKIISEEDYWKLC